MDNTSKILLGFLTGVVAGSVAGVLLAPEKGDATRKMIADKAKSLKDNVEHQIGPRVEKLNEVTKSALDTVNDYANKVWKKEENETASATTVSSEKS